MTARSELASTERIVVKLGTRVLTHDDGALALSRLYGVVESVVSLIRGGREVLLVSSGAVGLGREVLGQQRINLDLVEHQTCAMVGQSRLMGLYEQGFTRLGVVAAQILLTQGNFDDRARYLSLRNALSSLVRQKVVPVINMNDSVATEEELAVREDDAPHVFGDNDRLAAIVATKLGADLLILLTDVDGVYDGNPRRDPAARLIPKVDDPASLGDAAEGAGSQAGKGGMKSKVRAAEIAVRGGCHVVIASGRIPHTVEQVAAGAEVGTWFPAQGGGLSARSRWIAFAAPTKGVLRLDAGAVDALRNKPASLLPAGVSAVEGSFTKGDVVELRGPDGELVGRGMAQCDTVSARHWCSERAGKALVRRELMVLEGRKEAS